jgi:hypothetical protein
MKSTPGPRKQCQQIGSMDSNGFTWLYIPGEHTTWPKGLKRAQAWNQITKKEKLYGNWNVITRL